MIIIKFKFIINSFNINDVIIYYYIPEAQDITNFAFSKQTAGFSPSFFLHNK